MTEVTADSGPPVRRAGSLSIERLGRRLGIRMTIPAQLLLVFIVTFPALMLIYLSLTWWGPLDGTTWIYAFESLNWFDNYVEIFQDGRLWGSVGRTFLIMAVVVPIEFLLGLGLATLFVDRFHGKRIFYVILLMPMMIVPSVAGYMFFMLFQSNGPINQIISGISGLDFDVVWLGHPIRSMIAIMVADIWQWTPLMFLILLAGIISVPEDQLKAATLLGANWFHKFWRIVLPRMKIVMVIALVNSLGRGVQAVRHHVDHDQGWTRILDRDHIGLHIQVNVFRSRMGLCVDGRLSHYDLPQPVRGRRLDRHGESQAQTLGQPGLSVGTRVCPRKRA